MRSHQINCCLGDGSPITAKTIVQNQAMPYRYDGLSVRCFASSAIIVSKNNIRTIKTRTIRIIKFKSKYYKQVHRNCIPGCRACVRQAGRTHKTQFSIHHIYPGCSCMLLRYYKRPFSQCQCNRSHHPIGAGPRSVQTAN